MAVLRAFGGGVRPEQRGCGRGDARAGANDCDRHADAERASARRRYFSGFSAWPPNSKRIADSTLSWNPALPRELKRS
jgi:hypothetical protein